MRLQSVRFDHPRFDGLQQLNLGPVTALWGANDSGKSTTLRALSAVLDADPDGIMASVELRGTIPGPIAEELAMRVIDGVLRGEPVSLLDGTELYEDELSGAARADLEGARDNGAALSVLSSVFSGLDRGSDALGFPGLLPADAGVPITCALARDQDQHSAGWQVWASLSGSGQQQVAVPLTLSPDPELSAPIPVAAPLAWEAIERRLDAVASELAAHAQAPFERALEDVPDAADIRRRLSNYVGGRADRDLPDFVGLRYQLRVDVGPGGQVHLQARRIADEATFEVRDLAEGLKPWLQLAVLVATARLELLARLVEQTDAELQPQRATELDAVLRLVAELTDDNSDALADALGGLIDAAVDDADLLSASKADLLRMGRTIVLMDEPEAHLHPAAQRQAARWIHRHAVHLCDSFVMVSHAPTFLGMEGLTDVSHVSRSADHRVIVRPLDPRDLNAIDHEIEELGFDRGELLALYRAVLFVEGAGDQTVLETLYAEELRDTGILVQSFSGASTHRKITEAELLLRVLGPPFHVLVDNVAPGRVEELEAAGVEDLEVVTRDRERPDEEKFLAHILLAGQRQCRSVRVHGISARDILGALDANVVAELGGTNGAREAWPGLGVVIAIAKERGAKYDSLLGHFGVSKRPDFMGKCAQEMKRRGIRAPELDDVIRRVRRSIY